VTVIREADGIRWYVDAGTDDTLGPEHEAEITGQVLGLLPVEPVDGWEFPAAGGVLLDVGAHVGHYTLRAAKAGHGVIAVEANPETAGRLFANVLLNGFDDRVKVIGRPAWDQYESIRWKPYHEGSMATRNGSGRVYPDPGGELWPVVLDDVITPTQRIDLVKLDTEGAEIHVLRGMRATLKRARPVLWVELHDWTGAYTLDELTGVLQELHYGHRLAAEWSGLKYWECRPL
jgi:FkbM family methyltransferase